MKSLKTKVFAYNSVKSARGFSNSPDMLTPQSSQKVVVFSGDNSKESFSSNLSEYEMASDAGSTRSLRSN